MGIQGYVRVYMGISAGAHKYGLLISVIQVQEPMSRSMQLHYIPVTAFS